MISTLSDLASRVGRRLAPASLPPMGRPSFRWEITSACFLPMAVACVEGNVIGVIAKKAFDASDLVIATLAAAPAMSNITSIWWTGLIRGRDRVRAVNLMQAGTLACVAVIALAPFSPLGQLILVLAALAARSLLTGIITARSDIWRANYPRTERAKVTGAITVVAACVVGATAVTLGLAMDTASSRHAFRPIYLAAALLGLVGVWAFSRVRWRGRGASLRAERDEDGDAPRAGARDMLRVLRSDADYRRFMTAQFVLGLPNLAGIPVFIIALEERFQRSYSESLLLAQIIPLALPILTIPLWARLLDRMHIVRFRVYHSWLFVLANLLMWIGFLAPNLPLLYAARIVLGTAYGGGMIAWNLGHHDFARRDLATLYMGIHVTLTGVRGAIAPFLGALLYAGSLGVPAFALGALHFPGARISIPAFGAWTYFLLALGSIVGALLFLRLDRSIRARSHGAVRDA